MAVLRDLRSLLRTYSTNLTEDVPGQSRITTQRKEADKIEILSGVFDGKTLGTPISMMVRNTDAISKSYEDIKDVYRPGHADFTYDEKVRTQGSPRGGALQRERRSAGLPRLR